MRFAFNKTVVKGLVMLLSVLIIGVVILVRVMNGSLKPPTSKSSFINDSATSDTPVETLKTLTAEISAVEQQNQQLITQNKLLTEHDKTTLAQVKKELQAEMQQQLLQAKTELQTVSPSSAERASEKSNKDNASDATKKISVSEDGLTWVMDLKAAPVSANTLKRLNPDSQPEESHPSTSPLTKPIKPYYTIPINATLTGAIAMQPLIGRIPLEGKVHDPYTFKAILGPKNLAANGIDIPADIQGIVASGIAEGDLLGRCARGEITSMTFIFADGRISTTQAKENQSLGTIAAANGNPCIAGTFHSDAAIFLGAQAGLAGLQGYGNALSQAQLSTSASSTTGASISALIGNANKYAFGQGFAASAQAAQQWWNQRVQSSFDFVYVPNVDPKTGKKLELNINITQEIALDYNPDGRKVVYGYDSNDTHAAALD